MTNTMSNQQTVLAVAAFEVIRDIMPSGEEITVIRFYSDAGVVDAPMLAVDAHRLGMALIVGDTPAASGEPDNARPVAVDPRWSRLTIRANGTGATVPRSGD